MKPTTKVAIAGLLSAAGAVLNALAAEYSGATPETPVAPDPAVPKKPKKAPAAAVAPETPETPAVNAEGEVTTEDGPKGKTYEELKALIAPLVKDGQGLEVKAIIAKYDPESNPPSLKTMPAKNHAAFEKDLQALSY